jgi:hypothetical protein
MLFIFLICVVVSGLEQPKMAAILIDNLLKSSKNDDCILLAAVLINGCDFGANNDKLKRVQVLTTRCVSSSTNMEPCTDFEDACLKGISQDSVSAVKRNLDKICIKLKAKLDFGIERTPYNDLKEYVKSLSNDISSSLQVRDQGELYGTTRVLLDAAVGRLDKKLPGISFSEIIFYVVFAFVLLALGCTPFVKAKLIGNFVFTLLVTESSINVCCEIVGVDPWKYIWWFRVITTPTVLVLSRIFRVVQENKKHKLLAMYFKD